MTIERDRIRFSHPLLASVLYGSASHERRRQLHKRLAVVVSDIEQRARHLALSTTEPDEATAAELEQAAQQAAAERGAQQAAAELFAAARRLTPEDRSDELTRRTLGEAGGATRRRRRRPAHLCLRRQAAATCSPQPCVREALLLDGRDQWVLGTFRGDRAPRSGARRRHLKIEALAARVYPKLVYFNVAHVPARARELRRPGDTRCSNPRGAPGALASVAISRMWAGLLLGEGTAARAARTMACARGASGPERTEERASTHLFPLDRRLRSRRGHATRSRTSGTASTARTTGARSARARAFAEFRAGQWDLAEELVEESCATIARPRARRGHGQWSFAFARSSTPDTAGRSADKTRCCR